MRKKYVLLILALFLTILSYFLAITNFKNFNPFVNQDFSYKIYSCNKSSEDINLINVQTKNNSIIFNQTLMLYCNANNDNFKLKYSKKNNELLIREVFNAKEVTGCVCPTIIEGSITNIERGDYKLRFLFVNKYVNMNEELDFFEIQII